VIYYTRGSTEDFLRPLCKPQDWLEFNEAWHSGLWPIEIEPCCVSKKSVRKAPFGGGGAGNRTLNFCLDCDHTVLGMVNTKRRNILDTFGGGGVRAQNGLLSEYLSLGHKVILVLIKLGSVVYSYKKLNSIVFQGNQCSKAALGKGVPKGEFRIFYQIATNFGVNVSSGMKVIFLPIFITIGTLGSPWVLEYGTKWPIFKFSHISKP
jgi:hypothetical protein